MTIFIDTSAFLAVLNSGDKFHDAAKKAWLGFLESDSFFITSNYVQVETIALLQSRFGIAALRIYENEILPVVRTLWVDEDYHKRGMGALLVANRRNLSLVDCVSFELVRENAADVVFTFDSHFKEQGFGVLPE